jgi:exopolysaccharide biosynthesis polyprenyl glycosylphosphotransferase
VIRRHVTALRLALMTADALSAIAVFVAVSIFRFGANGWVDAWANAGAAAWPLAIAYSIGWSMTLWVNGLYRMRSRWSARTELADIARAGLLLAVLAFAALFLFKLPNVSRLFLLTLFPAQVAVTTASRLALRLIFANFRSRGYNTRYALVIGTGRAAEAFADRIEHHRELGLRVIGHLSSPGSARRPRRPVLGSVDEIETVLHAHVVDEVAICLSGSDVQYVEPITRLCADEGRVVRIPITDGGLTVPGARLEEFDGIVVASLVYGPDRILSLIVKRLLDLVLSAAALVVLSPLFLVVAIAIRRVDGQPILFRQARVGLHGRSFQVVKFRTMVPDAERLLGSIEDLNEIHGHAFKLTDDPRLSRSGGFLRRTSLDELPQLWNVLRGEMSLVGPRPPLPREVADYDVWHRRRLSMKPGITGLWQVEARRDAEFDRWVAMDLAYIDRWSLWLDLKIIVRTIPAVLAGEGR